MNTRDNENFHGAERSGDTFPLLAGLAMLLAVLAATVCAQPARDKQPASERARTEVQAAFGEDCEKLLVQEINRAKKEILVAIYNLTRRSITGALADAVRRGASVRVKYDATAAAESDPMKRAIEFLNRHDVKCTPIEMSGDKAAMHDKFTVIDRKRVLTGSFNYTTSAATTNYENIVLIESEDIARKFAEEFEKIKSR